MVATEAERQAVAARVSELAAAYEPPSFQDAAGSDAALFLCAVDHRTGYRGSHCVGGAGPYSGSELLWHLGCAAERAAPGSLSPGVLAEVDREAVERMFRAGEEVVAGAEARALLWRDLAVGLQRDHDGSAANLLAACESRLGGSSGLIARLSHFDAYSDPLAKKSFLFAKIAARRRWLEVADPQSWEVCADNVLMRLALRAGLVEPGDAGTVRARTRDALKRLAAEADLEPPLLDDLLWELGREDPDLLGTAGGDLWEPPRPAGTVWY